MNDFYNIFWPYGVRECSNNQNINFLKLSTTEYLVFRASTKGRITDLLFEVYQEELTPCNSEPISSELVRQGFNPKEDVEIIKEFINK